MAGSDAQLPTFAEVQWVGKEELIVFDEAEDRG
jgi:hypothetical protein